MTVLRYDGMGKEARFRSIVSLPFRARGGQLFALNLFRAAKKSGQGDR
jgi:hypothetical protein